MFAINFVAKSKTGIATVDFNSKNNQGASVNQLKDIVINISKMANVLDATNTLNIKEVVNQLKKTPKMFLFDDTCLLYTSPSPRD